MGYILFPPFSMTLVNLCGIKSFLSSEVSQVVNMELKLNKKVAGIELLRP